MIDGDEYVLTNQSNINLITDIPDVVQKAFKVDSNSHLLCYKITVNHFISKDKSVERDVYLTIEPVNGSGLAGLSYSATTSNNNASSNPNNPYVSFETRDYTIDYVDNKGKNISSNIDNVLYFSFDVFYPDIYNIGLIQSCDSKYVSETEDDGHIWLYIFLLRQ